MMLSVFTVSGFFLAFILLHEPISDCTVSSSESGQTPSPRWPRPCVGLRSKASMPLRLGLQMTLRQVQERLGLDGLTLPTSMCFLGALAAFWFRIPRAAGSSIARLVLICSCFWFPAVVKFLWVLLAVRHSKFKN